MVVLHNIFSNLEDDFTVEFLQYKILGAGKMWIQDEAAAVYGDSVYSDVVRCVQNDK